MSNEMVRAFGRALAETEWLSPEDLRAYQLSLLSPLLSHARATTDFYAQRLDFDVGDPQQIEQAWSSIPILTRMEAAATDSLTSCSVPAKAGGTQEGVTSGSTATPVSYRRSGVTFIASQAALERQMRWWNVNGAKSSARISFQRGNTAPPPHGTTVAGWHSEHPQGVQHVLSTEADLATQVDWLAARRPAYLMSYSNVLKELAMANAVPLRFDLLFSFGTALDSDTRELCRAAFGAEIADSYAVSEIGMLATQCCECGEYHVSAESALVEVLRPDGSSARAGEVGRVVVTSLYNYAMPMIRYEVGDLAEVGSEAAACGRGLPSLRRILGRYRNAFRFRDGVLAFPLTHDFRPWELLPLRQFQIVQLDYDRIEVRWVPDGSDRPADLAGLTERVRSVLKQPVTVSVRTVESIQRSPSGKFEDYLSLVPLD